MYLLPINCVKIYLVFAEEKSKASKPIKGKGRGKIGLELAAKWKMSIDARLTVSVDEST